MSPVCSPLYSQGQYSAYWKEGTLNTDQSNQWMEESLKVLWNNLTTNLWDVSLKDNLITQVADAFTDDKN